MSETSNLRPFFRRTYAEVDTTRVAENFRALSGLLPAGEFICPMVKANAYGHGDVEIARALRAAGARHLGVGLIEEGLGLRQAGDEGGLLLFGIFEEGDAETVLEYGLTPVISEWHELESLKKALVRRMYQGVGQSLLPLKVHFKFNTGMNRLGFDTDQAPKLREWLDANKAFVLEGVCTHLLRGDDAGIEGGESESQLADFARAFAAFKGLPARPHVLNSSGLANLLSRTQNAKPLSSGAFWPVGTRPGIATYGVQPSNDEGLKLPVKPVLSFKSHLVMLHRLRAGERVSYNATWRATRDSVIGVVPVGYADGYFRALSNKASVLFRGLRAPAVGTICMDYFMVDLTEVEVKTHSALGAPQVGEEVVLIGEQSGPFGRATLGAEDVAKWAGTIPYEVLTDISERVPRVYLK
jgi:alanine racemase